MVRPINQRNQFSNLTKDEIREITKKNFWNKVDKITPFGPNGDCWRWTAAAYKSGYGKLCERTFSGKPKSWLAHRFSYFLAYGEIPKGILVCHSCDNPACVNPDHLFLGTHKDNMIDCKMKGRVYVQPTKFTKEENIQIRSDYDNLPLNKIGTRIKNGELKRLATKWGCSKSQVWNICNVGLVQSDLPGKG